MRLFSQRTSDDEHNSSTEITNQNLIGINQISDECPDQEDTGNEGSSLTAEVPPSKSAPSGGREFGKLRRVDLLAILLEQVTLNDKQEEELVSLRELVERLKKKLDEKDLQIEHLKRRLDEKDAKIAVLASAGASQGEEALPIGALDVEALNECISQSVRHFVAEACDRKAYQADLRVVSETREFTSVDAMACEPPEANKNDCAQVRSA